MNSKSAFESLDRLYPGGISKKASNAHICVIGIGGVGSWVCESLVRSGIGELTLIDLDDICVSNINRQLHTLKSTIGKPKTMVMKDRLLQINPECQIHIIEDFLTEENALELLSGSFSLIVDSIDDAYQKCALILAAKKLEKTVICVGASGGKKDPSKIRFNDLAFSEQDPLLARVRKILRRKYGYSRDSDSPLGIESIYCAEKAIVLRETGQHEKLNQREIRHLNCEGSLGSASFLTGSLGLLAASRVMEKLNENSRLS